MSSRTILITGASRGIGRALAVAYAEPGVHLALVGRDEALLSTAAATCLARGADATVFAVDVRDRDGMAYALATFDLAHPLDLVVANAGVALPTGDDPTVATSAYDEIEINLVGALNTAFPAIPLMTARGAGQIALVSSLAAFAPLPDSPGYSASKAGLLMAGLALRERLRPRGIRVNVVCPGYIATAMGERYEGWKPLTMAPERAAERIRSGLARDMPVIAFPRRLALAARLSTLVPDRLRRAGLSAFRFRIGDG